MKTAIVIPARYASQRYPGKPLVPLTGADGTQKTLIERSWDAAASTTCAQTIVVATDDDRIAEEVRRFGGEVVMTPESCRNGTERCAAALAQLDGSYDVVVNLQGDAPLTPPWFVDELVAALADDPSTLMATPVLQCKGEMLKSLRDDRKAGLVGATTAVFDREGQALYFSKEVLPYSDKILASDGWPTPVFHHVGVYAYRKSSLVAYGDWPIGPLEHIEGLEQLRFLENGHPIKCVEVDDRGRSLWELNNPHDVPRIEAMMKTMGIV